MQMKAKLIVGSGAALLTLLASGGVASASPDVESIVNSTCSYPQVMSALNATSPATATQITTNPLAASWLQQLVASPPPQRRQMVAQVQGMPALQEYTGLINQVAVSCNNY